ncbi:hypothetical protein [Stenotrophomonas rhizophila]|uniref:Uncharacterized protein n=1 Tax=Stenotrophomonas rhizophila TaxID=216778 RepID=A0A7V7YDV1_9GAMM|nr:hypothetical protein [Stenotrophomonas rhizophila]KAB7628903.1 hypothetical protein F9K92_15780 [Stenotrophomonas rhizophila]
MSQAGWKKIDSAFREVITSDDEQVRDRVASALREQQTAEVSRDSLLRNGDLISKHVWMTIEAQKLLSMWDPSAELHPVRDEDRSVVGMVDSKTGNIVAFTAKLSDRADVDVGLLSGRYAVISYADLMVCVFDSFDAYQAKWVETFETISPPDVDNDAEETEDLIKSLHETSAAGDMDGMMRAIMSQIPIDANENSGEVLGSRFDQLAQFANQYKAPTTIREARQQAASIFRNNSDNILEGVIKGLYLRGTDDVDDNNLRHCAIASLLIATRHLHEIAGVNFNESNPFSNLKANTGDDKIIQAFHLGKNYIFFGEEPLVDGNAFQIVGDVDFDTAFYIDVRTRQIVDVAEELREHSVDQEELTATPNEPEELRAVTPVSDVERRFPHLVELINGHDHEHLKIVAHNIKIMAGAPRDQLEQFTDLALKMASLEFKGEELATVNAYIRVRYAMRDSGFERWVTTHSGEAIVGFSTQSVNAKGSCIMLNHMGGTPDQFVDQQVALFGTDTLYFVNADGISKFTRTM